MSRSRGRKCQKVEFVETDVGNVQETEEFLGFTTDEHAETDLQNVEETEEFLGFTMEDIQRSSRVAVALRRIVNVVTKIVSSKFEQISKLLTKRTKKEDAKPERRYPKRSLARVNYKEEEVPDDDDYIYCDDCQMEWEGDCPHHGPLTIIEDAEVASGSGVKPDPKYAMNTVPSSLHIAASQITAAGLGVWTKEKLPQGLRFGPYGGIKVSQPCRRGYCWEIKREKKVIHYIDAYNPSRSNWMRYVNCARNEEEQNLVAFQYKGEIYYRTTQEIMPGVELLVWYGDDYGKELGIDVPGFHRTNEKSQKIESASEKYSNPQHNRRVNGLPNHSCMRVQARSISHVGKKRKARICQSDGSMSPKASGSSIDSHVVATVHHEEERMLSQGNLETCGDFNGDDKMSCSVLTNGKGNAESNHTFKSDGTLPMNKTDGGGDNIAAPTVTATLRDYRIKVKGRNDSEVVKEGKKEICNGTLGNNNNGYGSSKEVFHCYECGGEFNRKNDLIKHLKVHFGDFSLDFEAEDEEERVEDQEVPCTLNGSKSNSCEKIPKISYSNSCDGIDETNGDNVLLNSHAQSAKERIFNESPSIKRVGVIRCYENIKRNRENTNEFREGHSQGDMGAVRSNSVACKLCLEEFSSQLCLKSHVLEVHLSKRNIIRTAGSYLSIDRNAQKSDIEKSQSCESIFKTPEKEQLMTNGACDSKKMIETNSCSGHSSSFLPVRTITKVLTHSVPYSRSGSEINTPSVISQGCDGITENFSCKSNHMVKESKTSKKQDGKGGKRFRQGGDGRIQAGSSELVDKNAVSHERGKRTVGVKCYECSVCSKSFNCNSKLQTHIRIHTGHRPYKCSVCSKSFFQSAHLQTHIRIHTGQRPYKCSVCFKSFNRNDNLQTHIRTHTGEKPYECSVCSKYFNRNSSLQRHIRIHTGEKPYECSVCSKSFSDNSSLRKHIRIHNGEKPYECSVCSKSFFQNSTLQRHIRTHTGHRPYKCTVSSKSFSDNSSLRKHIRTHTGEKPYECSVCSKSFSQNSDLQTHIRIHTGHRPYKCNVCSMSFSDNSNLRSHIRTHTGDKPYKCNICSKSFTISGNLNTHMRTHKSENLYRCHHCSFVFKEKSKLRKHILNSHVQCEE